jgi:hypothetical protein
MVVNPASNYVTVLDTGLPALPSRLRPGWPVPVAVWNGVVTGRSWSSRTGVGKWGHRLARWDHDQLVAGVRGRAAGGRKFGSSVTWTYCKVEGFVGSAARWVELQEGTSTTRRPIAESGAVVVVLDGEGPATVRILDDHEVEIDSYSL